MQIYKDKYQVFKNGVIKDLVTHKILPQYNSNQGYRTVFLRFQGQTSSHYVHEIVAECYVTNPEPKINTHVTHLDKNKLNNEADNLAGVPAPTPPDQPKPTETKPTTHTANLDETFTPYNQNTEYKPFMNGQYYIYKDGRVYDTKYKYYITPIKSQSNNLTVRLYNQETGKYTNHYVHRLMADLYMENPHNAKFLKHKDGNNANNTLDNLEGLIPKSQSQAQKDWYARKRLQEGKGYNPQSEQGQKAKASTIPLKPTSPTTLYQDIKAAETHTPHDKEDTQEMTNKTTAKYKFLDKEWTAEELVEVLLYFNQLPNVEKI